MSGRTGPRRPIRLRQVCAILALAVGSLGAVRGHAEVSVLRLGAQFGLGYLPLYVARDAGLIEREMQQRGLKPVPLELQNVAGAPQINDGLLSRTLDIGCGGITALMVAWDKTRGSGGQMMKGGAALSAVPYVLMTVDPAGPLLPGFSERNRVWFAGGQGSGAARLRQIP